jgi:hypothetical protein
MQTASQGAWQPNQVIFFSSSLLLLLNFIVKIDRKYGTVSASAFNCFWVGFLCSGVGVELAACDLVLPVEKFLSNFLKETQFNY